MFDEEKKVIKNSASTTSVLVPGQDVRATLACAASTPKSVKPSTTVNKQYTSRTLGNLSIHKVLVLSTPTVYPKTAGTYSYPLRLLMCKKTRTLYLFHASTNEELRFGGVVPRAT